MVLHKSHKILRHILTKMPASPHLEFPCTWSFLKAPSTTIVIYYEDWLDLSSKESPLASIVLTYCTLGIAAKAGENRHVLLIWSRLNNCKLGSRKLVFRKRLCHIYQGFNLACQEVCKDQTCSSPDFHKKVLIVKLNYYLIKFDWPCVVLEVRDPAVHTQSHFPNSQARRHPP